MSIFKTCPNCGAHLDPSEICECMKKAVPMLAHEDGKLPGNNIASFSIPHGAAGSQERKFLPVMHGDNYAAKIAAEAILRAYGSGPSVEWSMNQAGEKELKSAAHILEKRVGLEAACKKIVYQLKERSRA